jgi:penicillin G amidase
MQPEHRRSHSHQGQAGRDHRRRRSRATDPSSPNWFPARRAPGAALDALRRLADGHFSMWTPRRTGTPSASVLACSTAPGQNVVYADVDGNIGYQATGQAFRFAPPAMAACRSAARQRPRVDRLHSIREAAEHLQPASGIIGTANGRITPDDYKYSISMEWEAPWRTGAHLPRAGIGTAIFAADMLALQTDVHSEADLFAAERFVYCRGPRRKALGARQTSSRLNEELGWTHAGFVSRANDRGSRGARSEAIAARTKAGSRASKIRRRRVPRQTRRSQLRTRRRLPELANLLLGAALRLAGKYSDPSPQTLAAGEISELRGVTDGRGGSGGQRRQTLPKDLASWHWGSFNAVEIQHPVLGKIPLIQRWTGPGVQEQSGSGYTVKAVTRHHGPSERFTANLADLDQSTLNIVTGQGGNFLSPYYMDQWKAWYEGNHIHAALQSRSGARRQGAQLGAGAGQVGSPIRRQRPISTARNRPRLRPRPRPTQPRALRC